MSSCDDNRTTRDMRARGGQGEDEQGPKREYRVLIVRPGVHEPIAYFRTAIRDLAEQRRRDDARRYRVSEPWARVWVESREVGPWERVRGR